LVAVCAVGRPAAASLRDNLARASQTVGISSGSAFDNLAEAIAITNANNIPVVSASAGFTYRYNSQLEAAERTAETLGPIFLERPQTLGQGKFNVNLSWQYGVNQFDGRA
jgi:DNA-binding transcriptional regulator LsrR (DeoR family)